MKIVRLESENIKGIKAVEIEPDGTVIVVGGKNGAGKSSVLDSIFYALGGKDALPTKPLRNGQKKGKVSLDLGDIHVERTFTESGSKVVVKSKEGASYPSPQAMLDALCSRLAFDPLELLRLKPDKQAEQLRQLVGIDFRMLDAKRKDYYEARTRENREVASAKANLESAERFADAPEAELSLEELTDELQRREEHNSEIASKAASIESAQSVLEQWQTRVEEIESEMRELAQQKSGLLEKIEVQRSHIASAEGELKKLKRADVDEVRQRIRSAGDINRKVAANRRHAQLKDELSRRESQSKKLTDAIEKIDAEKQKLLESAPFPVPGLGFDENGITFNGLPFDQCSSAERLRVLTAWTMAEHPKLRVMLIRDASLLDDDGLQILSEMAETNDYQLWLERVAKTAEGCTVFIEDGAVKEVVAAS